MPTLKVIDEVFDLVNQRMNYDSDQRVFGKVEYWKSWKDEILAGKTNIKDDCDGYALTFAELFLHKGFEKKNIAICFCSIEDEHTKQLEWHLLCKVKADDGNWYVVDNNVMYPMRREHAGGYGWHFIWDSCMYLDQPGVWVKDP
jgi:predicted transglutaminase-like cysteine proteinase